MEEKLAGLRVAGVGGHGLFSGCETGLFLQTKQVLRSCVPGLAACSFREFFDSTIKVTFVLEHFFATVFLEFFRRFFDGSLVGDSSRVS